MTVSYVRFLERHPEFSDTAVFPQSRVEFFLEDLDKNFDLEIWTDWYEEGVCLLAAHNLVIDELNQTNPGNVDDLSPVTVKAVGDVSHSLGTYLTVNNDAEDYNLTIYGRKYYRLQQTHCIYADVAY